MAAGITMEAAIGVPVEEEEGLETKVVVDMEEVSTNMLRLSKI